MIADILLDTLEHDLSVSGFDLQLVAGIDRVAQQIKIRLMFFLGEWFLNTQLGVPYYRDILVKNPDRAIVEGLLRDQIITTPNVQSCEAFNLSYDSLARALTVRFRAITEFGPLDFSDTLELIV